jgi:hypothetical protein
MQLKGARGAEADVQFTRVEKQDFFRALLDDDGGVRLRADFVLRGKVGQQQPPESPLE